MPDSKSMTRFTFRLDKETLNEIEQKVKSEDHEAVSKSQVMRKALKEYL